MSYGSLLRATLPMTLATLLLSSWEELFHRGYLLQLLNEGGGVWFGTLTTGFLFGLMHAINPLADPLGVITLSINGVLLGWVVVRTGSLWLACGYHAGWNLAAAQLLGLRDSGSISPGAFFTTNLSGPTWFAGGTFGFESSIITGVTELTLLIVMLRFARRLPNVREAQPYFLAARLGPRLN